MFKRLPKICGRHHRDIGDNGFDFVESQFNRRDGGWQIVGEGLRDLCDLGEGRMGLQNVEHAESFFPIGQRSQHAETGRRPDRGPMRLIVDRMAPSAFFKCNIIAQSRVAIEFNRRSYLTRRTWQTEQRRAIWGERNDRALSNIRRQPIVELDRTFVIGAAPVDLPNLARAFKDRTAVVAKDKVSFGRIRNHLNLDLRLKREARQEMAHQSSLNQRCWHKNLNQPVIGKADLRCAQQCRQQDAFKETHDPSLGSQSETGQ